MWEQYKKTFLGMQCAIALIAYVIHTQTYRQWQTTAVFVAVMQVGALVGAAWASRLRRKIQGTQLS
jgi:uncharacterized membrane protein YfcA